MISNFRLAYDLVYTPPVTAFLRSARDLGLETISGWEMFVEQGAAQIRIFTGAEAPEQWRKRMLSGEGKSLEPLRCLEPGA